MLIGATVCFAGLWNAEMARNEKGCCFTLLMYGLFAAVSLRFRYKSRCAIDWKGAR